MLRYDLLLKNGHVLDPGEGIDARLDVAIHDGRIAAIESNIPPTEAQRVMDVGRPGRYVVPGLIDVHAHVAYGATTRGVGNLSCQPDKVGVESGVTTLVDAGSVGIGSFGVFPAHILPTARTRIVCYVNVGTFAHAQKDRPDVTCLEDISLGGLADCVSQHPGLVAGMKLRLFGEFVRRAGEEVIDRAKAAATSAGVPLMVHIGELAAKDRAPDARITDLTAYAVQRLGRGDILTHLCTPRPGSVEHAAGRMDPLLAEARQRGVVLDVGDGRGHFSYRVAVRQFGRHLHPDTISTDLSVRGESFLSLPECMGKFMAVGYSLADVIRMTTSNSARAIGLEDSIGALRTGREADITVLDVVDGDFLFSDAEEEFSGDKAIVPVLAFRAGTQHTPRWGPHPWGWLPRSRRGQAEVGP